VTQPTFRSDIKVTENTAACCGSDRVTGVAAWAVPPGGRPDDSVGPVISGCMKGSHNSPFEHGLLSVYAEVPGVVWWQLTRQRFMSLDTEDFAFSLESGRYKRLDPEFYLPPQERPCREPDGFRPMRPELLCTASSYAAVQGSVRRVADYAWDEYQHLIGAGVAREVARLVLPNWALYCDGYVTAKPLTWVQFFSKRKRTAETAVATYPQFEIEKFCEQCEALFAARWPLTYAAFLDNGRVAP
jgi:thymidylate synthase (FAD)